MKNRLNCKYLAFLSALSSAVVGCVNPPQRASGVNPSPSKSPPANKPFEDPSEVPVATPSPVATVGGNGDVRGLQPQVNGGPTTPTSATGTEVSYWLNKTDNTNCLTIQAAGSESAISSPCPNGEGPKWVDNLIPGSSEVFKATIKVDTTDKNQNKYSSSSDALGDLAWRWRCVSKTDPATKKNVHVVCYEDGNTLKKDFESSDLFIRITGPESVDLGGIKCTKVTDFDLTSCSGK